MPLYIYIYMNNMYIYIYMYIHYILCGPDCTERLYCSAVLANSELKICKTENDGSWWILNETDQLVELKARELYGFNVGSFAEIPAGLHTTSDQQNS